MKTMYFKLTAAGSYIYCNRLSEGYDTIEVTNIPEDATIDEVIILLHKTNMWMVKSVEYSQLGTNKPIIRNTVTPTEQKIIDFIKNESLTNRQIAERLGIAEGTIRTHMSRILIKLNIKSRKELKESE